MTLGSLFDGSGGFPLAAVLNGIRPVWLSEIEPFPLKVTETRFPDVTQYGDIKKMNGAEIEPVDIISFGSPCQDLSLAGARAGLDGARSGLFYEALRLIGEMRNATINAFPRFAVWENVLGAYSSNDGQDFRACLQGFCDLCQKGEVIPMPESGKWKNAGSIVGEGWSLCWRTFDAQFWGVPQHRERIYLVADFAGERSGEILFEQDGVSEYSATVFSAAKRLAEGAAGSFGTAGGGQDGRIDCYENHGADARYKRQHASPTLTTTNSMPMAVTAYPSLQFDNSMDATEISPTLLTENHKPLAIRGTNINDSSGIYDENRCYTLDTSGAHAVFSMGRDMLESSLDPRYHMSAAMEDKAGTLVAQGPAAVATSQVRMFTPKEYAMLQGFPEWWCDGIEVVWPTQEQIWKWRDIWAEWNEMQGVKPKTEKETERWLEEPYSDKAEYKMWGNGIALPCALFVLERIATAYKAEEYIRQREKNDR